MTVGRKSLTWFALAIVPLFISSAAAQDEKTPAEKVIDAKELVAQRMGIDVAENSDGILEIRRTSDASDGRFEAGDQILEADGKQLVSLQELGEAISSSSSGSLKLKLVRGEKTGEMAVKLLSGTREIKFDQTMKPIDFAGMTVMPGKEAAGLISKVTPNSPAWNTGIREGDQLVEVDQVAAEDFESLSKVIETAASDLERLEIPVKVHRGEEQMDLSIQIRTTEQLAASDRMRFEKAVERNRADLAQPAPQTGTADRVAANGPAAYPVPVDGGDGYGTSGFGFAFDNTGTGLVAQAAIVRLQSAQGMTLNMAQATGGRMAPPNTTTTPAGARALPGSQAADTPPLTTLNPRGNAARALPGTNTPDTPPLSTVTPAANQARALPGTNTPDTPPLTTINPSAGNASANSARALPGTNTPDTPPLATIDPSTNAGRALPGTNTPDTPPLETVGPYPGDVAPVNQPSMNPAVTNPDPTVTNPGTLGGDTIGTAQLFQGNGGIQIQVALAQHAANAIGNRSRRQWPNPQPQAPDATGNQNLQTGTRMLAAVGYHGDLTLYQGSGSPDRVPRGMVSGIDPRMGRNAAAADPATGETVAATTPQAQSQANANLPYLVTTELQLSADGSLTGFIANAQMSQVLGRALVILQVADAVDNPAARQAGTSNRGEANIGAAAAANAARNTQATGAAPQPIAIGIIAVAGGTP